MNTIKYLRLICWIIMSVLTPKVVQLQLVMNLPSSANLFQLCLRSALCVCKLPEYYFYIQLVRKTLWLPLPQILVIITDIRI